MELLQQIDDEKNSYQNLYYGQNTFYNFVGERR